MLIKSEVRRAEVDVDSGLLAEKQTPFPLGSAGFGNNRIPPLLCCRATKWGSVQRVMKKKICNK